MRSLSHSAFKPGLGRRHLRVSRSLKAVVGVCTLLPACPSSGADIPLEKIWALKMPGTRDIRELDPKRDRTKPLPDESLPNYPVAHIQRLLGTQYTAKGDSAGKAFAVSGTGRMALKEAHDVFTKKQKRAESLPAGDVSIVFYTYAVGSYVHLGGVELKDGLIKIKYRFVAHSSRDLTVHFALIPLRLQQGKYQVTIDEVPHGIFLTHPIPAEQKRRFICNPFEFVVTEPKERNP